MGPSAAAGRQSVFAFPSIVLAEKYRKMRSIFLTAIGGIILGLLIMIFGFESKYVLIGGLGLFFIAFNVMEALLPSWLSKAAPIQSKATAMGVNASSQFLGAFLAGLSVDNCCYSTTLRSVGVFYRQLL